MLSENQSSPTPFAIYTACPWLSSVIIDPEISHHRSSCFCLYPGGTLFKSWPALLLSIWCRGEKLVAIYLHSAKILYKENLTCLLDAFCCYLFAFGATAPQWARASSFTRFLDHTQRSITVGRTPLDEYSARSRDLYLTTQNTHNRDTSMPPAGFEPTILAGERP